MKKKYDKTPDGADESVAAEETSVTETTDAPETQVADGTEVESTKKKSPKAYIADFFKDNGFVICAAIALLLVAAMVLLAVLMGGDIYDKAAYFWIIAFLADLTYYVLGKKTRGAMIAMIVTGALAVGCVVLYGLELGGILP